MPAKLLFTLLCDDVREEKSGKLTVIGLYNKVIGFPVGGQPQAAPVKYALPQLCIVLRWSVEAPAQDSITEIIGPTQVTLARVVAPFAISAEGGYSQQILKFFGMIFEEGPHTIRTACGTLIWEEKFLIRGVPLGPVTH